MEGAGSELAAHARRLREQIASHEEAGTVLRAVPLEQEVAAHIRPVLLLPVDA